MTQDRYSYAIDAQACRDHLAAAKDKIEKALDLLCLGQNSVELNNTLHEAVYALHNAGIVQGYHYPGTIPSFIEEDEDD